MEIVEGTKKGVLLLKVVEMIKSSKAKMNESSVQDESVLLDKQFQLQELEMEKLKMQMKYQEEERKERELDRAREREREAREREKEQREREREQRELEVLRRRQGMVQDQFNVSSTMKLVPVFDEENVAEFFAAFEKIANKLV